MPPINLPGKIALIPSPTPLVPMPRLLKVPDPPDFWLKRDENTAPGFGGNKVRKLEYLLADALRRNCDTVITAGAIQSNHCRQTAAAAASVGLECHLALGGEEPPSSQGNLLLDRLFGARIHWMGDERKGEGLDALEAQLQEQGKRPCVIPYGGSNTVGALGFVEAAFELERQLSAAGKSRVKIVIASSSGGTQAGLSLGIRLLRADWELHGINVDKDEAGDLPYRQHLAELASATAEQLGSSERLEPGDFQVHSDFIKHPYAVMSPKEKTLIKEIASRTGVLLDPVYTARAMAGCVHLIEQGIFKTGDTLVFWHTGGLPALFAYADDLMS